MANECDSTGKPIVVGDKVRWRGQVYTIKAFREGEGRIPECSAIDFEESKHLEETSDEWGVDKVTG